MSRSALTYRSQAAELAELRAALAKAEAQNLTLEMMLNEALRAYDRQQRAFHHRIKNSLQIIQSYLALARREHMPNRNISLVEAEARVLVISGAYRLALGEGNDHHLCIKAFIDQIVMSALQLLPAPLQQIRGSITVTTMLALDQAIPIGLGIVEAAISGLAIAPQGRLTLTCQLDDRECLHIVLALAGAERPFPGPNRIVRGLQAQVGAVASATAEGIILDWRIAPAAPSETLAPIAGDLD
jgi:two-component sensor histidine kinase